MGRSRWEGRCGEVAMGRSMWSGRCGEVPVGMQFWGGCYGEVVVRWSLWRGGEEGFAVKRSLRGEVTVILMRMNSTLCIVAESE